MYAVGLGILLLALKYLEVDPVAAWSWVAVLSPFGIAIAWWAWADSSGWTKRKAMQRENDKKQARIDKNRESLGTLNSRKRR
jgi:small Trp-rich protein